MRLLPLLLTISVFVAVPAVSQAQAPPRWDVAFGPHVVVRESSSRTHVGGGVAAARRFGRAAVVFEGGGTRRDGHNDWRVVGGPRVMLSDGHRAAFFVQALAGTLIRQKDADWAVMPGMGIDVRWTNARAIRFQIDAPIERSEARTAKSVRASVWLVF